MENFTVTRTGRAPLVFVGELIAEVEGDGDKRWHDLRLYRTQGGAYVAHVEYRTRWEGEIETSAAEACDSPEDVERFFLDYDPTAHVLGYPPTGPQMQVKQDRLLRELRLRYDDQVSRILDAADIVEVVE